MKRIFSYLALLALGLCGLSACTLMPSNTSLNATAGVPFRGLFGIWFTDQRSSIVLKPGDSVTVNLDLRFSQSSSGRVEPGTFVSQYQLWASSSSDQLKVSFVLNTIRLNETGYATLRVADDAKPGWYPVQFEARRISGTLGENSASSSLSVQIVP
jgi:hypothetical protein